MDNKQADTKQDEQHACEQCGTTDDVTFAADPFAAEIHNDSTPRYMCGGCRYQSAMDI